MVPSSSYGVQSGTRQLVSESVNSGGLPCLTVDMTITECEFVSSGRSLTGIGQLYYF
jgi:hypothetical protein